MPVVGFYGSDSVDNIRMNLTESLDQSIYQTQDLCNKLFMNADLKFLYNLSSDYRWNLYHDTSKSIAEFAIVVDPKTGKRTKLDFEISADHKQRILSSFDTKHLIMDPLHSRM